MRPFVFGEIFMFRSQEDSPYGLLSSVTVPYTEITEHLIPFISGQVLVTSEQMPRISSNCFKLVKPTNTDKPKSVTNESFAESYIDLDVLRNIKKNPDETPTFSKANLEYRQEEPENVVELSPKDITRFNKALAAETKEVQLLFIKTYLPKLLGIQHGSAYTEAFVRDGLGIEGFSVNEDMLPYILNGTKIDFVAQFIMRLPNLPDSIKEKYLDGLVTEALATAKAQIRESHMREHVEKQRYASSLDNPVGHVKHSNVGVKKSKQRKPHEEKASTKGKD